jgi:hypothetical protein
MRRSQRRAAAAGAAASIWQHSHPIAAKILNLFVFFLNPAFSLGKIHDINIRLLERTR